MNKFFTRIVGAALGLAMAIGVGVAVSSAKKEAKSINAMADKYTVGTTALSSVSNGDLVAWGTSSTNLAYTIESDWVKCNGTKSNWYIFQVETTTGGFYLKNYASQSNYVYSSAAKKVAWSTTNKSVLTLNSVSGKGYLVNNSTAGNYTFNSTGIRPYPSSNFNEAHLYLVTIAPSDPVIASVTLSKGNPTASEVKAGGSSWTMAATVATTPANDTTLSRNVTWSCSPNGAVSFSKTTSASEEDITVTAVNNAQASVTITATSAQTSAKYATSNTFSISKSYSVNTNTLVTKDGKSEYDAEGATSLNVAFISTLTYTGDAGAYGVNLSVSPNSGVSFDSSITSSASGKDFNITFTKDGTYTVTATPVENAGKAANVTITIEGIVIPGYELVTSTNSLRNNAKVIIHSSGDTYKRFMTTAAADYRNMSSTNYTVTDDFIPEADLPTGTEVLTLVTSGSHWNLKTHDNKYLSLTNNDNKLYTVPSLNEESTQWDIAFTGNNVDITSVAQSARTIRLNGGSSRFACYAGTQQAIQLYLELDTSPYFTVNTTSVYLGNRGTEQLTLTAHNGATDTVTWSSNNAIASVSPTSGLSTIVTAADSGEGVATITATFGSGEFDPIQVTVNVTKLDAYVNIGVTTFTKVTAVPTGGWVGTYLLVDETANVIFNGSASPLGAGSEKEISAPVNNQISATSDMIASSFNVKTSTNGYTLRSNSNYFVGNQSKVNGIATSIGKEYEISLSVSDSKPVITALLEDGSSSDTTLRHNASSNIFRFYTGDTGNEIALYKANGEMRAITNTLTAFYDTVKSEEYLVCNDSGTGSNINWTMLEETAAALSSDDLDTLENMAAKPSKFGGNYLEDLISDYDYLVAVKHYDDFLGREAAGTLSVEKANIISFASNIDQSSPMVLIIVITISSVALVGGFIFFKKRRLH